MIIDRKSFSLALVLALGVAAGHAARAPAAESLAAAGRTILQKNKDAVVTVKLVVRQSVAMGGRQSNGQEQKSEVTGTVISPAGLTVVSLAATDPSEMIMRMAGAMGEMDEPSMKFECVLTDVKLVRPDGKELAAKVVLRDKDLDLAFLLPSERSAESFACVDLKAAAVAQILDDVVVLNRLGQVAGRVPAVTLGRVSALIEKPRRYYVLDHDTSALGLGTPVFVAGGRLLGLVLLRSVPPQGGLGMSAMFSGSSSLGLLPVVVPADQVREAAEQAPADQPAAKKAATPAGPAAP